MVNRWNELINVNGVMVDEIITDYGFRYEYMDGDNKITYEITELTFDELWTLSEKIKDYTELELILQNTNREINTIVGMDWDIELGTTQVNIMKVFRVFEKVGQRYASIHKPDVIYYRFDDKRMHKAYEPWIIEGHYELRHLDDDIAIYYREIGK